MSIDIRAEDVAAAKLTPIGPKANTISGEPFESELVMSKDDVTETGIWEVTPGVCRGSKIGMWEYMHFVSGAGTITDESGNVTEIRPGVACFIPDGWTGVWNVTETVRKTFVISSVPGGNA